MEGAHRSDSHIVMFSFGEIRNLCIRPFLPSPADRPPPPIHRTPYVTGTTVLGMKYKDGVMIACDTLGTSMEDTFG